MKRIISVFFLSICLCGTQAQTTAQQDAVGRFRVIPSIMLTYNPYSLKDINDNYISARYQFQYGLGIETEYRFHEVAGVALGVDYMVQGLKLSKYNSGWFKNNYTERETKVKSIGIPLLACVHPLPNDRLTLRLGIQKDFLIDMGDEYKSTCTDFLAGIAYSFDDKFQFDIRYNTSFSGIMKNSKNNPTKSCFIFSFGIIL